MRLTLFLLYLCLGAAAHQQLAHFPLCKDTESVWIPFNHTPGQISGMKMSTRALTPTATDSIMGTRTVSWESPWVRSSSIHVKRRLAENEDKVTYVLIGFQTPK